MVSTTHLELLHLNSKTDPLLELLHLRLQLQHLGPQRLVRKDKTIGYVQATTTRRLPECQLNYRPSKHCSWPTPLPLLWSLAAGLQGPPPRLWAKKMVEKIPGVHA